ncbi:MAG: glycosyltransferase, partial [Actinobacteria bacterium]|nr:glycosyltransferase [Actinomycetota bacterium]
MSDQSQMMSHSEWPTVSVVMPIRHEAKYLEQSVQSILLQTYPREFDICLAVAPSSDATEAIAQSLCAQNHRISVIENPSGKTASGLNAAIAHTKGQIVVRVDGHATLSPDYILNAVTTLRSTGAANVGGIQRPTGRSVFERAVARAMTSKFGTGGSKFHVGGQAGPTDSVYLGVFDRTRAEKVGWFDERLIRNQDYELNIRLRRDGATIWFDPNLWVDYQPRSSLSQLARQYFQYGWWKAKVVSLHPSSLRLRQSAPVLVTVVLLC